MPDDEMITHKGVQPYPTAAAPAVETSQIQQRNRGACAPADASGIVATAAAEFDDRKPPPETSSAYTRPASPSCGDDSRKNSNGSRKTSFRHNSGNSRKSSDNNLSGSRGSSGVQAETYSSSVLLRRGSSSTSRHSNSRASSNSGAVNDTITARKCVGCAAVGDSVPVANSCPRVKTSSSDAQSVASLCELVLTHPFTGTISYASSTAAHLSADERAQSTAHEVLQQQQHQQQEDGQHGAQRQQHQPYQQQARQQRQHGRPQEPHEVLRHQHTPEKQQHGQQHLPSLAPVRTSQPHSIHDPEQQNSTQLQTPSLASRVDDFGSSSEQQKSPAPLYHALLQDTMEHVREEHHTQRHSQQQLHPKRLAEHGLQPPQQILQLQHQPVQRAQQPQQQRAQQDLHRQQQKPQLMQSQNKAPQVLQSHPHPVSFVEYTTTQLDTLNATGEKCSSAQLLKAARVHAAASAAQNGGLVMSCLKTEECGAGAVPLVKAGKVSGLTSSKQTGVQQQQQPQEGIHQSSSAALQCSITTGRQPLGSNAVPSPSVAAAGATPLTRLAAASKRHQPPPCTAVPSTLPRCSSSASGAYPEMTAVPLLNGDSDVTTTATGKRTLSPAAAAVLRGAASAAAAAAAAATDAATLVMNTHSPRASAGSTGNAAAGTAATGAAAPAVGATAAAGRFLRINAPPAAANTVESLEMQKRDTANSSALETAENIQTAVSYLTQERQQQQQQHQQYQQVDRCSSRCNLVAGTKSWTERAEGLLMPVNTGSLVRNNCNSRVSCPSSSSDTINDRGSVEELQILPLTAPRKPSSFQDNYASGGSHMTAAGADEVNLAVLSFARRVPLEEVPIDPLSAASSPGLKNPTRGRSAPDAAAAAGRHALPHRGAPALSVSRTAEEAAAAGADVEAPAPANGKPTAVCKEPTSVAASSSATVTATAHQTHAVDSSAATFGTAATSAGILGNAAAAAATEKVELRGAEIGRSPAEGDPRSFAETVKEAAVGVGRPCSLATLGRQRHTTGSCGRVLQPLQLPESPRNGSTSAGGSPAAGAARGEAALAKDLSPTATPGTPQNRHQVQPLLMHRTPAPQDRPRRPAAAAAAGGVVVRRGGPVAMWGNGPASRPATVSAAEDHAHTAAAEQGAPNAANTIRDGNAIAPVCSNTAAVVAVAGDAAMAPEGASAGEAARVHGNEQQDPSDASSNSSSPEERLDTEGGRRSEEAHELQETKSYTNAATQSSPQATAALAAVTRSAAEQGQTGVMQPAENTPTASEYTEKTRLQETKQTRQHTVLQPHGTRTPQEANHGEQSAPVQQQQLLEENPQRQSSTSQENQAVRKDDSEALQRQLHRSGAQQQHEHYSDTAQEQQGLMELGQKHSCELMREGQRVLQRAHQAVREITTDEGESVLQSVPASDETRFGTSTLSASKSHRAEFSYAGQSVAYRDAVAAGAASPSCSWSPAATEEEQQHTQMLDAHGYPHGELVYFNGGNNWCYSRSRSTHKKDKKRGTKHHNNTIVESHSGNSGLLRKSSSTGWSDFCSRSILRDSRSGGRTGGSGGDTLCGSDPDLTYFPFSQDEVVLVPTFINAGAAGAAAADGTALAGSSDISATWQMQAASDLDAAVCGSANTSHFTLVTPAVLQHRSFSGYGELQQQKDADTSASVNECGLLDSQESCSLLLQPTTYVSKDERDMEDNLPVSAAAMAAAAAAAHSKSSPIGVAAKGLHTREPVLPRTFPQQDAVAQGSRGLGSFEYASPAAAWHANRPWTAHAWDPSCKASMNHHEAVGEKASQIDDVNFPSQLHQSTEEVSMSQLQQQIQQQQQRELGQLQQQYTQPRQVKSCWSTATDNAAGTECAVDWHEAISWNSLGFRRPGMATPTGPVVATAVASPVSAVAAAGPQDFSRAVDSCPSRFAGPPTAQTTAGASTQAGERQLCQQLRTQTSAGRDASFFSREPVLAKLCLQHGHQQQEFPVPQQQHFVKTEGSVSQPAPPSLDAAVPLHEEDGLQLPCAPSQPPTWPNPSQQQTLQPQKQQLLRGWGGLAPCHLKQISVADAALSRNTVATGGADVTTGKPTCMNAVQGEAIPVMPLHEPTPRPQHDQPLQQQQLQLQHLQQQQQLQQQLQQLHAQQHQEEQVGRLTQSSSPLARSCIQAPCNAQVLRRLPAGDTSSAVVDGRGCGAALVAPPPRQQQSFGDDGFLATPVAEVDYQSVPADRGPLSSRLKRAAPGAAAAALAAAATGAATATSRSPAGSGTTAPAAASTALLARHQEEDEAFCPFRRTVETRRTYGGASGNSSSNVATGGADYRGDTIEFTGEERLQSHVTSRSTNGIVRKRFLGGTTRLFGGVKTHAAVAANRQGKVNPSNSPVALALSAPHQASQSDASGHWERGTPTHTPRADTPSAQHFSVDPIHHMQLAGMQQHQPHPFARSTQQQPAGVEQQQLQQPLSPLSQRDSLSQQHIPRTDQQLQCNPPPETTHALSPFFVQQDRQLWLQEQQKQQQHFRGIPQWSGATCVRSPRLPLGVPQQERMPSRYLYPSAGPEIPRRRNSCSSTFLCETISGSNNCVAIAPVGRGSQRGSSRRRRKTPPPLPCVAGRLLLAGGRVVGEVGQAAVDVGSTVVKELASVLQRSLESIIDKGENIPCIEQVEHNCVEHQRGRSNSLCMPVTRARSACSNRSSSHLLQLHCSNRSTDPALGAGQAGHGLPCQTEEQLQHNLWLQQALPVELQQQQQRAALIELQQQEGDWRQQLEHVQQPEWRSTQSWSQLSEEHKRREPLEQRNIKEGTPVKVWGIATEERLGGLWLPKVDCQHSVSSQPETHSGTELNANQQQASLQESDHEASQHQQLKWCGEKLKQQQEQEEERKDTGCQQRQVHSVTVSHKKYAELANPALRYPEGGQSTTENMPDAIHSPYRLAEQEHAPAHPAHHSQEAGPLERGEKQQKNKPLEHYARSEGIPVFPISLRWNERPPQTSGSHSTMYTKQDIPTSERDSRKYLEQQEARDRLVRLAAPVTSLQSSDRCSRPCMQHSSSRVNRPFTHGSSCWNDNCEHAIQQQRPFQQETSTSSTADARNVAFRKQHDSTRSSSDRHGAAPSRSASSIESTSEDSNKGTLFQTDKKQSSAEFREPRKGTSTFGRPDVMQQFAGEHTMLLCYSDDGSNCSTVNSCREDDGGRRNISVETLSPRVSHPLGVCSREALSPASSRDENQRDGVLLQHAEQEDAPPQPQNETLASEVRRGQQEDDAEQQGAAIRHKRLDTVLHLHMRPQQQSCLSLQVQGIPPVRQPLPRHSELFSPPPSRVAQRKQESSFSMPYGMAMQETDGMHAKLEACDRIVQRWKERATKTVAESLATGARRGS